MRTKELESIRKSIIKRKEEKQTQEKLVIYDVKGEFLSKWYQPGEKNRPADIIFFPFDERSIQRNL
jgi:hypothetical protein